MDQEILRHFFEQRHDQAAPGRPGQASPVLELIVEQLPEHPATVFSRSGEVLLQTRPAVALFGDYTGTGGSSPFLVDRWLTDPSARERYLVPVGVPVRHRPRCYRHVALGGLALYRDLLVCPAEFQLLLVFMSVPGSASHTKLGALTAALNHESSADRR